MTPTDSPQFVPEVHGAVVLAVKTINKAAGLAYYRRDKDRRRKLQEKAQKHIARAKYQANRGGD